jgi:hypothetical protein
MNSKNRCIEILRGLLKYENCRGEVFFAHIEKVINDLLDVKDASSDASIASKIKNLIAEGYKENFDYDEEYWTWGNFDDIHQYGIKCGEQSMLGAIQNIIDSKEPENDRS